MSKEIALCLIIFAFLPQIYSDSLPDFYTFDVVDIEGNTVSLEKFRGSVSLVVNVATLCGFTDSTYRSLKRLQDILGYKGKFNVLAFPCNQFGEQEPYENEVINNFAKTNYGAEFPMFSKIDVIGENAHPAYKNLIAQSSVHPEWNFYKYLVDHNGRVVKAWSTKTTIEEIFDNIQQLIGEIQQETTDNVTGDEQSQKDEL